MGAPTFPRPSGISETARIAQWTLTSGDATGDPIGADWLDLADKCVSVTGTFGTGTFLLEGSNDGAVWFTLNTPAGVAISGTTAAMRQVLENPVHVRPRVTGADGTTNLTVIIAGKRPTLGRM